MLISELPLRNVMLDIAVSQRTGFPTAGAIEDCLCPQGYSGRSCEQCSVGHFRDKSDRSRGPLGTCRPCECGGNESSCEWDPSARGGHRCTCRAGYAGDRDDVSSGSGSVTPESSDCQSI